MPAGLNALLKRYVPGVHHHLKQGLARTKLPVPKMLLGRPVWTHARLLNIGVSQPYVLRWVAETVRPGDTFFDVGAHQGWMSLAAARRTGRRGRVVAFEPSPPLIEYLAYHKRMNRLTQMEIVAKAVTNRDASRVPFSLIGNGDSSMNAVFGTGGQGDPSQGESVIEIETITLDSFSRQSGLVPDVIKIDVEGAELWVCEGAREVIAERRPALILATHPLWLPEGQRIEDLFELLSGYDYRIVDSDIQKYKGTDYGDYLCVAD